MGEEHFSSQMNFLKSFAENYENREKLILGIDNRLTEIQPFIDEAEKLQKELADLKKLNKEEKNFLISMNDMVLRNTENPISSGPLFENNTTTPQE